MPSQKHVHRYQRIKIGDKKRDVVRCTLDNCTHILYDPILARYRKTICWGCGQEFELGIEIQVKPVCDSCKDKRKRIKGPQAIDKEVTKILDQFENVDDLLKAIGNKG